jgi:hypothetical protein
MLHFGELPFSLPNVSQADYLHYESNFNILIKFWNHFFFGNGEYFIVPIFWMVIPTISTICAYSYGPTNAIDPIGIFYAIITLSELYVNLWFGYFFCKHHILARMVLYYKQRYDVNMNLLERYFGLMTLLMSSVICFLLGMYIPLLNETPKPHGYDERLNSAFSTMYGFSLIFIIIGSSLYLCVFWCIQMWMVYACIKRTFTDRIALTNDAEETENAFSFSSQSSRLRSIDFVNTFDGDEKSLELQMYTRDTALDEKLKEVIATDPSKIFHQQTFERTLIQYLHDMREISDYWYLNHIVRTVTGFLIITEMTLNFYYAYTYNYPVYITILYAVAAGLYYFTIWITAFSTGMTNDQFFEFIITRLSCLYAEVLEENHILDERISRSISKVVALQASEGLHFGGVTMSTEKALTVGSVIGSLLVYVVEIVTEGISAA